MQETKEENFYFDQLKQIQIREKQIDNELKTKLKNLRLSLIDIKSENKIILANFEEVGKNFVKSKDNHFNMIRCFLLR